MEAKILENNAVITVELIGRLDTAAAQEVSEKLLPLQEKADRTIVLDCSQLNYISSSGLRIFLALRKASAVKGGKVIVKSINDDMVSYPHDRSDELQSY